MCSCWSVAGRMEGILSNFSFCPDPEKIIWGSPMVKLNLSHRETLLWCVWWKLTLGCTALIFKSLWFGSLVVPTYNISQKVRIARSWLKVCFLISLLVRVITEVRLERSPNKPNKLNRIPSHQNSNCFQTWNVRKLNLELSIITKLLFYLSPEITRTKVQRAFDFDCLIVKR